MAIITNSFEGGTVGATMTAGNSGGASGTAASIVTVGGATTIQYSATGRAHGNVGARVVASGGTTDLYRIRWDWSADTGGVTSARVYFTLNALPNLAQDVFVLYSSSGGAVKVGLSAGNTLQVKNLVGTTLGTYATALTAGTLYRLEIQAKKGTGTTDGQIAAQLYGGDGTTALYTYGATNVNSGTTDFLQFQLGENTAPRTIDITFDDVKINTASQAALGPFANALPTVSVSGNQNAAAAATVNVSATASDSDGTIASYAWSFLYPTSGAPALTGASSAAASFTAGAAGNLYVLQCTVTDDQGGTGSATTEVRVPVAGGTTMLPLAGTSSQVFSQVGTWTPQGGATSVGDALDDALDATYAESASVSATAQSHRERLQPSNSKATAALVRRLATDTGTATATVTLYEGTTQRQQWTQALTTTVTDYTFTLSAGTVSAIGDWGNLWQDLSVTS